MPFWQEHNLELLVLLLLVVFDIDLRVLLTLLLCLLFWNHPSLPIEITIRQRAESPQYRDAAVQMNPPAETAQRPRTPPQIPHIDIPSTIDIVKKNSRRSFNNLRPHLERRLQPQTHEELVRITLDLFSRYSPEQAAARPLSLPPVLELPPIREVITNAASRITEPSYYHSTGVRPSTSEVQRPVSSSNLYGDTFSPESRYDSSSSDQNSPTRSPFSVYLDEDSGDDDGKLVEVVQYQQKQSHGYAPVVRRRDHDDRSRELQRQSFGRTPSPNEVSADSKYVETRVISYERGGSPKHHHPTRLSDVEDEDEHEGDDEDTSAGDKVSYDSRELVPLDRARVRAPPVARLKLKSQDAIRFEPTREHSRSPAFSARPSTGRVQQSAKLPVSAESEETDKYTGSLKRSTRTGYKRQRESKSLAYLHEYEVDEVDGYTVTRPGGPIPGYPMPPSRPRGDATVPEG
ncbi:hypothetical protein MMC10_002910 [Thelotrema lepadinum]|nr:hypothetical protein [Thelotrema lepadinum]